MTPEKQVEVDYFEGGKIYSINSLIVLDDVNLAII
jgi:hypothetical protein